jgi:hypothetical protein
MAGVNDWACEGGRAEDGTAEQEGGLDEEHLC